MWLRGRGKEMGTNGTLGCLLEGGSQLPLQYSRQLSERKPQGPEIKNSIFGKTTIQKWRWKRLWVWCINSESWNTGKKRKKDTFPGNQSPESDCCRQTCLTRVEGGSPGWKGGMLDSTSGFCWDEGTSNRNYRKRSTDIWFCLETFWYQKWSSISAFPTMKTLHTNRSQNNMWSLENFEFFLYHWYLDN